MFFFGLYCAETWTVKHMDYLFCEINQNRSSILIQNIFDSKKMGDHLWLVSIQLHHQMEDANFESEASILSAEQKQEIVRRRVSPLFRPRWVYSWFTVLHHSVLACYILYEMMVFVYVYMYVLTKSLFLFSQLMC